MNPFLFLIKTRNYLGVVRVASSKPPGTIPMSFFCFIKRRRLDLSTDSTPHNLKRPPIKGKLSIALLLRAAIDDILELSTLRFASIPEYHHTYHRYKCYEDETQTLLIPHQEYPIPEFLQTFSNISTD